jgi:hypothetical protein
MGSWEYPPAAVTRVRWLHLPHKRWVYTGAFTESCRTLFDALM